MFSVLMNYIFVLAIGIFIGTVSAFEIFQRQLEKELNYQRFSRMIRNNPQLWEIRK